MATLVVRAARLGQELVLRAGGRRVAVHRRELPQVGVGDGAQSGALAPRQLMLIGQEGGKLGRLGGVFFLSWQGNFVATVLASSGISRAARPAAGAARGVIRAPRVVQVRSPGERGAEG